MPIPDEPKKYLDQYILSQGITQSNQAIFSKNRVRLSTRAIRYICQRISAHASLTLPDEKKFHLSPHILRHTFLKRVAATMVSILLKRSLVIPPSLTILIFNNCIDNCKDFFVK